MTGLRRALALLLGLAGLLGGPLAAETLRLRSGEHEGFSRIVVDGAAAGGWSLRRGSAGYIFRSTGGGTDYDLAGAFDRIPRARVTDLRPRADGGLDIVIACACHATAFPTASGGVAIDIREGPPPAGSRFEQPDEAAAQAPAGAARGASPSAHPSAPPVATAPDPHLPLYWRKEGRVASPAHPDAGGPAAMAAADAATTLPARNRAAEMRSELVEQLGRAAAQGLITIEMPVPSPLTPQPEAPDAPDTPPRPAEPPPPARPGLPLQVATSVDRDSVFAAPAPTLSTEGDICPPDADFAVADWGGELSPALQLSGLRRGIVGEFDRPERAGVIALARFYVHIGFGAEARMTLDAFDIAEAEAPWLRTLARIVDMDSAAPGALRPFAGCAGSVALWALLESADGFAARDIDAKAVRQAFSALPPALRRHLGPAVVERLIAAGHAEAAHAVRDAILRAGPLDHPALRRAEAELSLAEGDGAAAAATLADLAARGGAAAAGALVRAIRLRLDRGEAVPTRLAENAGALAQELRGSERGSDLAALHILSLASTGDFATALAEEQRWRDELPAPLAGEVLGRLLGALADRGDDWTFAAAYFRHADRLLRSGPDLLLRLALAQRLTEAGFDAAAADILAGEASGTERGRRLLARHALNAAEADRAMARLQGLKGDEAARLRAEAHLAQNGAAAAKAELTAAADAPAAARAAWMAGDWRSAARLDAESYAAPLQALGLIGEAVPADAAEGELASARRFVREAAEARGAFADLLDIARTP